MTRKIVNGLQLSKQCWQALRQNPQLMMFPLLSGIALLLVGIAIAMGRLGQILGFALISATIGTLAQAGRNSARDSNNGIAGILAAVVGGLVQGV
jgi:hypothetical protein